MGSLRSTEALIALSIVACFVFLGWLDYAGRTRAVERFDTFSSYDFHPGGYHAWYDLLRSEGIPVERYTRRPAYLTDSVGTLIVANNLFDALARQQAGESAGFYTAGDLDRLHRWVASGGRLVWLVDRASADFGDINIQQEARSAVGGDAAQDLRLPMFVRSRHAHTLAVALARSPLTDGVSRVSGQGSLRIPFDASPHVAPLIADDAGSVVGWYPFGRGSIVVVTDETLFENERLARADNARLAYNLAAFGLKPGDTIAFEEWSHGYQSGDTWWGVLPRTFQLAIALVSAALLVLLLGATWRFGPTARLTKNDERTSEEYVTSMADLLKRGRATRTAVRELAQLGLHSAARSAGLPDSTPATAIAARLRGGQAGDQRAEDLIALERLAGYEQPSTAELIRAAHLSRALRKDLSFDGSHAFQPRRSPARRSA